MVGSGWSRLVFDRYGYLVFMEWGRVLGVSTVGVWVF